MVLRGVTFHSSIRICLVVGSLLTVINQGSVIVGGDVGAVTLIRVGANYAIPYAVASLGYLVPLRRQ